MIIIRYFNILCFLFLIVRCDSSKKPSILPSNISIDSNQVLSNDLFDIIKDIQILKLKYENGSPYFIYTRPKKILIFKNKIYVKPNNFEILQFDISGVFLGKISLAESPIVNHKEITDFIIDRESNTIILHDFQKQRLSFYSLDLDYLYSENVGYNFTAFEKRNNYFYFFTSKHRNKIDEKFCKLPL